MNKKVQLNSRIGISKYKILCLHSADWDTVYQKMEKFADSCWENYLISPAKWVLLLDNLQKSFPYSYIQAVDSLVLTSVLKMNSFVDTWDGPNIDSKKKAAHSALDGW